jgi:hypothetical protein
MKIVDGECNLSNPIEYLGLSKVFALLLHLLDFGVHVSQFAINHNDAQIALLVGKRVLVRDYVDVP